MGLKIVVFVLFTAIVSTIYSSNAINAKKQQDKLSKSRIFINEEGRELDILDSKGNVVLRGFIGRTIPLDIPPENCQEKTNKKRINATTVCKDWKYRARFEVTQERRQGVTCFNFTWKGESPDTQLQDCFDLTGSFWYGFGQVRDHSWPLNGVSINATAFVTSHDPQKYAFGSLISRYLISSNGVAIHIPLDLPIFISYNSSERSIYGDSLLCLTTGRDKHPYIEMDKKNLTQLSYSICTGTNMISVHREVAKTFRKTFRKQQQRNNMTSGVSRDASEEFIHKSLWVTSHTSLRAASKENLETLIGDIETGGFEPGILLLDNRWERRVGELVVNETSLPNSAKLFGRIKEKGFQIMLSVSPFIGIGNPVIEQASRDKRLISDPNLQVPLLTHCFREQKQDLCALIDMYTPKNRVWFRERFKDRIFNNLKHFNNSIDGFFFSGVQVSRMPQILESLDGKEVNPDYFQVYYQYMARHVTSNAAISPLLGFDTAVDVGIGRQSTEGGFYRLLPFTSDWKGLQSVIPTVLSTALIGYSRICPGTVGGDELVNGTFDKELYIRWFQMAVFMPVLQFSQPPGTGYLNYESIISTKNYLMKLRHELIIPRMVNAFEISTRQELPVIRSLFFADSTINYAYKIIDEFLIGNDLLVAPVVFPGLLSRHIYLPHGNWSDTNQDLFEGGKWHFNYPVPLDKVAFFTRIK